MQKLVKPDRFVYNESLKDVIAYHDEDETICTVGEVLVLGAAVLGAAALIASGGGATPAVIWLSSYAATSGIFGAAIGLAC